MDRPNIIIFNPDQMRADSLHHLGNRAGAGIGKPRMESLTRERQNLFGYGPV